MNDTIDVKLDVLVPQGRDAHVGYAEGARPPGTDEHEPINFHAMAAATGGGFHVSRHTIRDGNSAVLVLITRRSERALEAVRALKNEGRRVFATWKECGAHQIAAMWRGADHASHCRAIDALADGWIAASPAAARHLDQMGFHAGVYSLPTPYPVDVPGWDCWRKPWRERAGIFIGTREWNVPTRGHARAVALAARLADRHPGLPVTVTGDGSLRGWWNMTRIAPGRNFTVSRRLAYPAYLEMMSRHRVVLQRDASGVPGQVAGDALLAGVPCLGGNGMVDTLAFGHLPGAEADDEAVSAAVERLLSDEAHARAVMDEAAARALEQLSFAAFRRQWARVAATAGGAR